MFEATWPLLVASRNLICVGVIVPDEIVRLIWATAAPGCVMIAVTLAVPVVPLPRNGIVAWQLKDVKDFFGPPVATGSGPAVTVPMNGAEFRAFVLLPR